MKKKPHFGNYLRAQRNDKGLSLAELARRTRIHKSRLSRIECGKVEVRVSELKKLARGLSQDPAGFATGYLNGSNRITATQTALR